MKPISCNQEMGDTERLLCHRALLDINYGIVFHIQKKTKVNCQLFSIQKKDNS